MGWQITRKSLKHQPVSVQYSSRTAHRCRRCEIECLLSNTEILIFDEGEIEPTELKTQTQCPESDTSFDMERGSDGTDYKDLDEE